MDDRNRGIYRKFFVSRVDGSSGIGGKHEHCFHFVIDVDHDPYAGAALMAYAEVCAEEHPKLSEDLKKIVNKITTISNARAFLEEAVENGTDPETLWAWFQGEKEGIGEVISQFEEDEAENGDDGEEKKEEETKNK